MRARSTFRGFSTIVRLGAGSAVTVLVLSSCGGYGGGSNYMAPSSTGGATCGGGAYSNPCPAPAVSISGPAANDTLSGMVMLTASASAMDGLTISKVEYFVDGTTAIGTATTSPYSVSWDSTKVSNGPHKLTAMATDDFMGSPNSATSNPVSVTVQNAMGAAAPMNPMQVFPAPSSSASGMARIEVQADTAVAHAGVSLKGLDATAVTINEGFAGETGPVLLRLAPRAGASGEWELPATTMLTAEQLRELRQGRLYAIASSAAHPAGEIRGQLTPAKVTVRFAELAPNAEARALGIKGSGVAAATVDAAARTLTVHLNSAGVDDAMTAQAATRSLTKDAVSLGHWSTERASLRDSDLEDFAAGRWSVSIAIPEEPDAAIAGTMRP